MLFKLGTFIGAGGGTLDWKIECDALTDSDWDCIAVQALRVLSDFSSVYGVPRGGLKLAEAINKNRHAYNRPYNIDAPKLFVDDVWTTGKSLTMMAEQQMRENEKWIGFVAFARGPLPPHVRAFMRYEV